MSFIAILMLCQVTTAWSQFADVNVELDLRRLSEADRQLFDTLAEDMENYFLNTRFSIDVTDLDIMIDIRLVLETVSRGGSQTTVDAQAILSNKMDQYIYAKGVQFPYSKGRRIYYSTAFDPLASFLDYYAFIFIAAELDTWDYMGGTLFFNRAVELADQGKTSDWSPGWDARWKKARKIKDNQYLRSMRYHYFTVLEALTAEEVDMKYIQTSMDNFYEDLLTLDEKLGSNRETLHFLKAYHESISELMAGLNLQPGIKFLIQYDPDHKEVYESYLKN